MGFTLDDLGRLKVKVTNGPVTAISMWGYTPVRITGVIVCVFVFLCPQDFYRASICEGGLGSRNSARPSVCLSHAWIVTNLNGALRIF